MIESVRAVPSALSFWKSIEERLKPSMAICFEKVPSCPISPLSSTVDGVMNSGSCAKTSTLNLPFPMSGRPAIARSRSAFTSVSLTSETPTSISGIASASIMLNLSFWSMAQESSSMERDLALSSGIEALNTMSAPERAETVALPTVLSGTETTPSTEYLVETTYFPSTLAGVTTSFSIGRE